MPYTRRISAADASANYPHYLVAMPVGIESATMISGYLGDGAHPPLHVHDVDQFFVVLGGSATMWLSGQERRWVLADESTGIHTVRITAVERTGTEASGEPASRDTDRLVIVTEGQLNTEIATRPGVTPAEAVIVLPAGVRTVSGTHRPSPSATWTSNSKRQPPTRNWR